MIAQATLEAMPGVHSVELDTGSPAAPDQDMIVIAGPVLGSLIFRIDGEEYHASMEKANQLLGGGERIRLRPRPTVERHGFFSAEEDQVPTANAFVTRSGLSVGIFVYRGNLWYVTPHSWACQVSYHARGSARIIPVRSEGVMP